MAPNDRLNAIAAENAASQARMDRFRADLAAGRASRADIPDLKQAHPVHGIVPIRAAGQDVVMFHAHDDVVVWEYLWHGNDGYEPAMVRQWVEWCRTCPGQILDIGAYSGLMSILAAQAHADNIVHLFEPLDRILERANINVKLNGFKTRIARHPVALSDSDGTAEILLYRGADFLGTGSAIDRKSDLEPKGRKAIVTAALDTYMPHARPSVVKIDVEGHELACLKGMAGAIRRGRPRILIEVWHNTRPEVLTFLDGLGYELARVEATDLGVNNYLATPRP